MAELKKNAAPFLRLTRIHWDIAPEGRGWMGRKKMKKKKLKETMLNLVLTHRLQWSSVHHKSQEILLTPHCLLRNRPLSSPT